MRNALFFTFLFSISGHAATLSGRTADGCTYKVINGQYLTSCPAQGAPKLAAQDQITAPAAAPEAVTDYSTVPVRHNALAPIPSVQMQPSAPATMAIALEAPPTRSIVADDREEYARARARNRLLDKTYLGVLLGSNTVKAANAGGGLGYGLNLGTNIDENFGVEMAYSYAKQDLNLGLASRIPENTQPTPSASNDANLASHLFSAELQGHLTDPLKRLRPYFGLGLGWKSSTLTETSGQGYGTAASNGSLHQTMLGGLGSAGTKLRLGHAVQLGFAFRYFFPIMRQSSGLEQPTAGYNSAPATRLSRADNALTGSSQYQLLGGVQYLF
jgi:hypothetical protein